MNEEQKIEEQEVEKQEVTESMEDYTAELNSSLRKIYPGDIMEGEVVAFNENGVILDLNYYATGRVPADEMSADPAFSIMTDVKKGDRYKAMVKTVDDGKGNILLSVKAAQAETSWDNLRAMKENDEVITGIISQTVPSGAIMYVEGIRGFIPASKLDVKYVEDTTPYLGKQISVKISEVSEERDKLILSAKELKRAEYVEQQAESIGRLAVGSVLTGTVESLQNYGAFVNIGDGISGLVHISEISDAHIKHPKAVLKVGQEVPVMIKKIENGKVSLSIKAVQEAKAEEVEEEAHEYKSEYVPNNPFADLLKDYMK